MQNNFEREDFQAPLAEINMTPLVDVMLVLLVILLITAPILNNSLNINLPNEKGLTKEENHKISLAIDKKGVYYFNEQPLNIEVVKLRLQENLNNDKNISVNLHIDKEAEFSNVASMLSLLQELQMSNVSFITSR
ncbi:MAG: biopolymer transporter ExbD [Rickettsiales bacterium]|nr:biopolymer transporter ExbD [Rickettsiales bacterium]